MSVQKRQRSSQTKYSDMHPDIARVWKLFEKHERLLILSEQRAEKERKLAEQERKLAEKERKRLEQKAEQRAEKERKLAEKERKLSEQRSEQGIKELRDTFNKYIGKEGNKWGALIENLVKGNLTQRLKEKGIKVDKMITHIKNEFSEFDIVSFNGKEIVVVEVKSTLDPSDVDEFKQKVNLFKTWWPRYKNKTIYAALAFVKANKKAQIKAEKEGFFIIEAVGDITIKNQKDFQPKEFGG